MLLTVTDGKEVGAKDGRDDGADDGIIDGATILCCIIQVWEMSELMIAVEE